MLAFVGVKMLLADVYKLPIAVSLGVIAGLLGASIVDLDPAASAAMPPESLERGDGDESRPERKATHRLSHRH